MKSTNDVQLRGMEWLVVLALAGTSLLFVVNVNDSTMLKRPFLYVTCGLLAAVWFSRAMQEGSLPRRFSPVQIVVLAYIAAACLSLFEATSMQLAGIGLADLGCFCLLFGICNKQSADCALVRRVVNSLLTIALLASLVAIYQIISPRLGEAGGNPLGRETISTFGNVTFFAGFLAPVSALIASQIVGTARFATRLVLSCLLLLVIYMLITTESRSAWAGTAAGFVTLIILSVPSVKLRLGLGGLLLAAGIVIVIVFPDMVQRRLIGIVHVDPTSSVARRLFFYRGAWNAFLDSPFLGQGIGTFAAFVAKYRPPDYWMAHSEDLVPNAHDEFLQILSETGIVGFALFVTIIYLCIHSAIRKLRTASHADRYLMIGVIAGIVAILVDNLASMNLRTVPVAATFWVLLAVSARSSPDDSQAPRLALPSWVRSLRTAPYLVLGGILVWYVPRVSRSYSAQHQYLAGNLLRIQNKVEQSTLAYRDAVTDDPDFAEARFYLAATLAQRGRYAEARGTLDTLIARNPYFPQARFVLGISLFSLGDTAGAVKALNEEMRIETSPQTLYYASLFQRRNGHRSEELSLVTSLLRNSVLAGSDQYVGEALSRLPDLCSDPQERSNCLDIVRNVVKAFTQDLSIILASAEYFEHVGSLNEARSAYLLGSTLSPRNPEILTRLSRIEELIQTRRGQNADPKDTTLSPDASAKH